MTTLEKAKLWLSDTFDKETRNAVQLLIDSNSPDLEDSFTENWNSEQEE
jgi:phosphoglucomutase